MVVGHVLVIPIRVLWPLVPPNSWLHCISVFAGRDASRGLAMMDNSPDAVKDEWDDISDIGPTDRETLLGWEHKVANFGCV